MKFGRYLETSLIADFEYQYFDYLSAKQMIKERLGEHPWNENDEAAFLSTLETELDKVHTFSKVKSKEISWRIQKADVDVAQAVAEQNSSRPPADDVFDELEEECSEIISHVHDFEKYARLNYTAFQKIIKKHDKQTGWYLRPIFAARLKAKPFFKESYDEIVVRLSKLYELVRTRGNPSSGVSSAGGSQQNFVRNTTKYFVHPENVTLVKLIILKHLPVLVFNPNKEFEPADNAISSIYYDNKNLEFYRGRLVKSEGAEAVRLRWYGDMDAQTIFVERKTHREDWTGETSVKARFSLKEKNVNAFLRGEFTVEQTFEKMRKEKKKNWTEIDENMRLAQEVQYTVITGKLQPVLRSFYNRTAFQLPGDARVRISLDTELTMVREDNFDMRERAGRNWRRIDVGIDWPFKQLPEEDVCRFPYAVLEVKLQTHIGQQPPVWIQELVASHLVEAVPKFSKFIHGVATLFTPMVDLVPYWYPQMDVDIRKPISNTFGIDRSQNATSTNTESEVSVTNVVNDGEESDHLINTDDNLEDGNRGPDYNDEDEDEADETTRFLRTGNRQKERSSILVSWLLSFEQLKSYFTQEYRSARFDITNNSDTAVLPTKYDVRLKAPPGKRIAVPVRIEPKVFFANERTFLAWLEFSIILGTIASGLLNFGDQTAMTTAYIFTLVALMAMAYNLALYLWRVNNIRKRRASKFDDRYGPTILCTLLLLIWGFNFYTRISQD